MNYKNLLKICDILFILAILSNFGAIVLTNALVVHKNPNVILLENNPAAAATYGYEEHPNAITNLLMFLLAVVPYFMLISCYLYWRFNVERPIYIWFGVIAISWLFILLASDFFNNLGFYLGRICS